MCFFESSPVECIPRGVIQVKEIIWRGILFATFLLNLAAIFVSQNTVDSSQYYSSFFQADRRPDPSKCDRKYWLNVATVMGKCKTHARRTRENLKWMNELKLEVYEWTSSVVVIFLLPGKNLVSLVRWGNPCARMGHTGRKWHLCHSTRFEIAERSVYCANNWGRSLEMEETRDKIINIWCPRWKPPCSWLLSFAIEFPCVASRQFPRSKKRVCSRLHGKWVWDHIIQTKTYEMEVAEEVWRYPKM